MWFCTLVYQLKSTSTTRRSNPVEVWTRVVWTKQDHALGSQPGQASTSGPAKMESPPAASAASPTTPRISRVCVRCASIKQACDGSTPCARCQRLSLPCHTRQEGQSLPPAKPRVRRVHTGCVTCKKRKRKCDEARPKCGDCVRLCLPCGWPAAFEKGTRAKRRRESQESVVELSRNESSIEAPDSTLDLSPAITEFSWNDDYFADLSLLPAGQEVAVTPGQDSPNFLQSPLSLSTLR